MNATTEGDIGDIIFASGVLSGVPNGPHTLLIQPSKLTKYRTDADVDRLVDLVKPLLEVQPYIAECRKIRHGDKVDWDSGGFRLANFHIPTYTLLNAHQRHFMSLVGGECGDGGRRWLSCNVSDKGKGRVVINRTSRYQNPFFPWKRILEYYGDKILFVGLESEHRAFCEQFGQVEYAPTKNMLELAEIIAWSLLFIGNQSSANAINEGLKHNLIQETALDIPDCIFKRDNAQHVYDGSCILPSFDDRPPLTLGRARPMARDINLKTVPPGVIGTDGKREPQGWVLTLPNRKKVRNIFFQAIVSQAKQHGMTQEDVIEQNIDNNEEYFFNKAYSTTFDVAKTAIRNAQ